MNNDPNANVSTKLPTGKSETTWGVKRWLIREIAGVLFVAATLFIPARSLDWLMGWALVGVYAVWVGVNALVLIPRNPELLIERATRRKDTKTWDTVLLTIVGLTTIAKHVVAGFDVHAGWTTGISLTLQISMLVVAVLGYALTTWAMMSNAFFSQIVRIQGDRGHTVATGGPYRYVRHPGYVGTIAFELATPIMLGSWWALIPGGLAALLFIVRTALEDRTLQEELDGYKAYAQQTRYRLLPGVW
jgi:protein-S-isoprenylcysteine O-methyltransferase Ste14